MNLFFSRFSVILAVTFVLIPATYAQSSGDKPKNEIEVRAQVSVPSGEANFSGTGADGSTIHFSRDFDFKNELGFQVRYTYRTTSGKHKFLVDYDSTDWKRDTLLIPSFTFRGETYLANANLSADLKLRTFRAMYAYRWGNEKVRIGPMVDLGNINTNLKITGTTSSGTRTADGSINRFALTVGYDIDYDPMSKVSIFHNLGGIVWGHDHLFHTEGGAKVFLYRNIGAVGGYKFRRYKLEDGPNFLTISQHGPFFGGVFRF